MVAKPRIGQSVQTTRKQKILKAQKSALLALEPRYLFDAAAVATGTDVLVDQIAAQQADTLYSEAESASSPATENEWAGFTDAVTQSGRESSDRKEIVFIDAGVEDLETLLANVPDYADVYLLDTGSDGVEQIAAILADQSGVDAVHILSHGASGALNLGTAVLTEASLTGEHADEMATIRGALSADADLLLYGCDFGAGQRGASAVNALAIATGADIAVSDDTTGSADLGGDWDLEVRAGSVEAESLNAQEWQGTLAVFLDDGGADDIGGDFDITAFEVVYPATAADHMTGLVQLDETAGSTVAVSFLIDIDGDGNANYDYFVSLGVGVGGLFEITDSELIYGKNDGNSDKISGGATSLPDPDVGNPNIGPGFTTVLTIEENPFDGTPLSDTRVTFDIDLSVLVDDYNNNRKANNDPAITFADVQVLNATTHTSLSPTSQTKDEAFDSSLPATPSAAADSAATTSGAAAIIDVISNDTRLSLDTIEVSDGSNGLLAPVGGTLTVNSDGTITYLANSGYTGTDTFQYRAIGTDGAFYTATVTVTVTAGAGNADPVAVDDAVSTDEDTVGTGSVLAANPTTADSDADLDPLTITLAQDDALGTITISPAAGPDTSNLLPSGALLVLRDDGTYSYDPNGQYETLADGQSATETFTYTISDGNGGTDTATVTMTINGVNDAPTQNGTIGTQANTDGETITPIDVTGFFDDVDTGDTLDYTATGLPAGLSIDLTTGEISGTIDPAASASGPYSVVITATDDLGQTATQSFSWTVNAVANTAPVAAADAVSTDEDTVGTGNVLVANPTTADSDADLDTLTVTAGADSGAGVLTISPAAGPDTANTLPSGATLVLRDDGTYSYDPNGQYESLADGQTATETFTYTISDGNGGTDTATVTMTINGVNDAPTQNGTIGTQANTDGETITPIDVTGFFNDVDTGDTLDYTATGLPTGLSVDLTTGEITGTIDPAASASGPYSVVITATDDLGQTTTQSFTWTVNAVANTAPVAEADAVSTDEDTVGTGNVLVANPTTADSDADLDTLTVSAGADSGAGALTISPAAGPDTANTLPSGATLVLRDDGTYSYDPNGQFETLADGQTATETFTYTISDGNGGTDTATVTMTINGVNDAPTPSGTIGTQTNTDGEAITPIDVTGFFNDVDTGDTLDYTATGLPTGLSVDLTTGEITGTIDPAASASGPYSVVITATDDLGQTTTQSFTWTVNAVANTAPVAEADAVSTDEDTVGTGNVLVANPTTADSDADLDTLTVSAGADSGAGALTISPAAGPDTANTLPSGATLVLRDDGTYSYDPNGQFETLADGQTATETFSYTISDGKGGTDTATVTMTINGVNDAPTPSGTIGTQTNTDGEAITPIDVTGFFNDVDTGDTLDYTATGLPTGLSIDLTTGEITGTIDPAASASGPYSVVITVTDDLGQTTTQSFTWTVNAVANTAPVAEADAVSTDEDTVGTGNVLVANPTTADSDADLDTLTVSAGADSGAGALTISPAAGPDTANTLPSGATLVLRDDGTYSYDPNGQFETLADGQTATETFSYTISDGKGGTDTATVTMTINGVNDAPTPSGTIGTQTNTDGEAITPIDVTGFFNDVDTGDTLDYTATGLPTGLSIDLTTGEITGTIDPAASASGPYSVVITVTDDLGQTTTQSFTWNVNNPVPVARNDTANATEDAGTSGNLFVDNGIGADTDDDAFTLTDVNGAPITGPVMVAGTSGGTFTIDTDGTYSFDPGTDFQGLDDTESLTTSAQYTITDSQGATSSATITVTVAGANDAPVAVDDGPLSINEDTSLVFDPVTGSDTDVDGEVLTITQINGAPITAGGAGVAVTGGTVFLAADGVTLTFTPTTDFNGPADFTYTVSDPDGATSTATVDLTVDQVNDAPVASGTIANQTNADGATVATIDTSVIFSDVDIGDTLAYSATGLPAGLSIDPVSGEITGTINPDASLSGPYNIVVTAQDVAGATATTTFDWAVTNPVPTAKDDTFSTAEDTGATGSVLADNGAGVDTDDDALAVSLVSGPSNGALVLNANGSFTYTPSTDFVGTDSFVYQIDDGQGGTDTATATITVTGLNDAPIVLSPIADQTGADGDAVSLNIATFFDDVDGDALTYTATGLPAGLVLDPVTGLISGPIDADASLSGPYTVQITATDPDGALVTTTFTWAVANPDPVLDTPLPDRTDADTDTISLDAATFFTDPDGDTLSYSATGLPTGITIDPVTGLISGDLESNASLSGPYTVTVTVDDGEGGTVQDTFTWNVNNITPTVANPLPDQSNLDGEGISLDVTDVFENLDGDPLTYSATGLPAGLSIDSVTGLISGTIDNSESLTGPFTVMISADDGSAVATDTFIWAVTNPAPVINTPIPDQSNSDLESVSIDGSAGITDPDADTMTYSATGLPPGISIDPVTGLISGTLDANASTGAPYTVNVTVNDGEGGLTTDTFVWAVNNIAPTAGDDTIAFDEDGSVNGDLAPLANDPDGDALTFTAAVQPANGTLTINPNGTYTYVPDADFNGTDSFTYQVDDGEGGTVTGVITFNIAPVDDTPVAIADVIAGDEDLTLSGNVIDGTIAVGTGTGGADTDVDSASITVTTVFDGTTTVAGDAPIALTYGDLTINTDGSYTYVPNATANTLAEGELVTQQVTYTITDGNTSSQATLTLNITGTNDAPVAGADGPLTAIEDTPLTIAPLGNDTDVDGDTLTITEIDGVAITPGGAGVPVTGGTVTLAADGTTLTFTPDPDFNGPVDFTYTAEDPFGGTATGAVDLTVSPVNDAPVANDDALIVTEDAAIGGDLLADNGSGVDSDVDMDPLTILSGTDSALGAIIPGIETTLPSGALLTLNANGTYSYDPNGAFDTLADGETATDTFSYTLSDGQGGTDTAAVTLTVSGVNDAPVVSSTAIAADEESTATPLGLTAPVDTDTTDVNTITVTGLPLLGTVTLADGTPVADGDPLTAAELEGLLYDGPADYDGFADPGSFTYEVSDGIATVAGETDITLTAINDAPVATGPLVAAGADGTALVIDASGSFSDVDGGAPTYSLGADAPTWLSIDPMTGVISGTPPADASQIGPYSFTVTADDGNGGTADLTVDLDMINPAPTAQDDALSATEDAAVSGSLLADNGNGADIDPDGDALQVSAVNGTSIASPTTVAGTNGGTFTVSPDGSYTFDSGSDFQNLDVGESLITTVSYTVSDGNGGFSTATATVTVDGVNDAPVAADDGPFVTNEDTAFILDPVSGSDTDVDGEALTITEIDGAVIVPGGAGVPVTGGTVTLAADGITLTFTPDADYVGTADFTYTVSDIDGATSTANVDLTVAPLNDAPVTTGTIADQLGNDGDTITAFDTASIFSDVDTGDTLTFSATGLPAGLTIDPVTGEISGTIDSSASQNTPYTITVTADDGNGGTVSTSFVWDIDNVAPIAADDTIATDEDTAVSGDVLADNGAGADIDPDGDVLTVSLLSGPADGSLVLNTDGTYSYTPDLNFNGTDSFTYQIDDGQGGIDTATVSLTIAPVNDAPVLDTAIPAQTGQDGNLVSLDTSSFFSDAESDALTFTATDLPTGLTIDPVTGEISGTIDPSASLSAPFSTTVTVTDPSGGTVSSTFTWDIANVDPLLDTALPDRTDNDTDSVSIDGASFFTDPDGDVLAYSATGLPAGITIDPVSGLISGDLASNASLSGPYTVTVAVDDGQGGTSSDTFVWTVENLTPTIADPLGDLTSNDGDAVSIDVTDVFANPDGDVLTYSASGLPTGLTIDAVTGLISGTIDASASLGGPFSTIITADDGQGGITTDTLTWTVNNVDPVVVAPVADVTSFDSEAVSIDVSGAFNDPDADTLTFSATGLPVGVSIDPATGLISGTLASDASQGSPYTVMITADDGEGGTTTDTFFWTMENITPTAGDQSVTLAEDGSIAGLLAGLATDGDGDALTFTTAVEPSNGTVTINPDGTYTYVPDADFTGTDSFVYQVDDGNGGVVTGIITIDVTPVNDLPVLTDPNDPANTDPDPTTLVDLQSAGDGETITPIDLSVYFQDVDGDALVYTATGLPPGLSIDPATGVISGTLDHDASAGGPYAIAVTATDPLGNPITLTFPWAVANPAPVAGEETDLAVVEDTPTTLDLTGNDIDPDGDAIFISAIDGQPVNIGDTVILTSGGTVVVNADGTVTYTPPTDATGPDGFTYTISDTDGGTDTASVTVDIAPVNDVPVIVDPLDPTNPNPDPSTVVPLQMADDGEAITPLDVSGVFGELDGDTLTYSVTGLPTGLTMDPVTGIISGTIDKSASENDPYLVIVTATDPTGESVSINFPWEVANVAPIANDDSPIVTPEDTPITFNPLSNDSDPDLDAIAISAIDGVPIVIGSTTALASGATVTVNADGSITYAPALNQTGPDVFTYTISDADGATSTATVTMDIGGINDAPVAQADGPLTTAEDTPVTIAVLGNDSDPDGDALTVSAVDGQAILPNGSVSVTGGTVTLSADGTTLTFTPDLNYNGTADFSYTVSDPSGLTDTVGVDLEVTPVNDAPLLTGSVTEVTSQDSETIAPTDLSRAFIDVDGDVLTFSATGLPPGLSIDPVTGIVTGTLTTDASVGGPYTVLVTATDASGSPTTETIIWNVDFFAPVVTFPVSDAPVDSTNSDPFIRTEPFDTSTSGPTSNSIAAGGIILDTVGAVDSLSSTILNSAEGAVLSAVNNAGSLTGTGNLSPQSSTAQIDDPQIMLNIVNRIDDTFGHSNAPFAIQDLTGFSLHMAVDQSVGLSDGTARGQIQIESVVRDGVLYVEIKDSLANGGFGSAAEFRATLADGRPLPNWLEFASTGMILGKIPVNAEALDLRITAILADGETVVRTVTIVLPSGEIQQVASQLQPAADLFADSLSKVADKSQEDAAALSSALSG